VPRDEEARQALARAFPDRVVELLPIAAIRWAAEPLTARRNSSSR
jgi:hypothetical protein